MTRVGEPADHIVRELWRAGQEFKRMNLNLDKSHDDASFTV